MHDFLNSIARGYASDPDVRTYTFVFPNVRSKRYFTEYMAGLLGEEPRAVSSLSLTLTELFEKGCGMKMASTERLLFMLYRAYCNVRGRQHVEPFDRFRFWGRMILNDFNDVDRYLADAAELFRNARDYKKIQAFYLTPAQEEIIRTYWGSDAYWQSALKNRDAAAAGGDDDGIPFWNHVTMKGEPERKYTQLWAVLGELYREFRRLLAATGECYPGMACRAVAETVLAGKRLPFNPRLFVFAGFNRLSHSEHALFRSLSRQGLAHFYWDYDRVLMTHRRVNTAGRFISTYVKEFCACSPLVEFAPRPASHKVEVIAVPSAALQPKVAARYLHGPESAMVLADGEMLVPTVASIPEEYEHVNVTMGYPMRFSALAQLFSLLVRMQLRARFDAPGVPTFFHDDIVALVSHPSVQLAFPDECAGLLHYMRENYLFNLPLDRLPDDYAALRPLFGAVGDDASADDVAAYVTSLLDYALERGMINGIDRECASAMRSLVQMIVGYTREFDITADRRTLLEMIEHSLTERTLPLEGESFEAMQVMGILETRGMGFPDVVMLSMNDDVFPGVAVSRSFIPESLRRAYGLPTRDHLEADAAYNFYRLLSHARSMTILYDARCGGLRTGQVSRYVTQLRYSDFPGVEITCRLGSFIAPKTVRQSLIPADYKMSKDIFADVLERFRDPAQLKGYRLSASDLKTYVNCPLQFFLAKVNDINPPEAVSEESGAADHGNVIHEVAARVYDYFARRGGAVTQADIDSLLAGGFDSLLERELTRAVNIHLAHYPAFVDGKENAELMSIPLDEKNSLYADAMRIALVTMFEKEQTPFTVIGTEVPSVFSWRVSDSLSVNFKMIIDRIDKVDEDGSEIVRIIDYKTGSDKLSLPSVGSLFEIGNPDHRKAVFQLLIYCAAYRSLHPEIEASKLRPLIFKTRNVNETGFPPITYTPSGPEETAGAEALPVGKKDADSGNLSAYSMVDVEFEKCLSELLNDIFDIAKPVERASDPDCCKYCNFKLLCQTF